MKNFSRTSLMVASMLLMASFALEVQAQAPLSPGMRVRVTVVSLAPAMGTVIGSTDSSFRFARENTSDTITVEYANVNRLDVSHGMRNRTVHDAIWGAGMGAALGAVVGAFSDRSEPQFAYIDSTSSECSARNPACHQSPPERHHPPFLIRTLEGLGIGAAAGFALGALYGQFRKTEVWESLPAEKYHVHVAMTPVPGGVGLRFTMAM